MTGGTLRQSPATLARIGSMSLKTEHHHGCPPPPRNRVAIRREISNTEGCHLWTASTLEWPLDSLPCWPTGFRHLRTILPNTDLEAHKVKAGFPPNTKDQCPFHLHLGQLVMNQAIAIVFEILMPI